MSEVQQHVEESAEASPRASKERHSLTLDQRRALRRWANAQPIRPSHKACIEWFKHEYGQSISQSTVSHSLSPKYARLDGDTGLSGSRLRFGNWPDVERLVLLWHDQMVNSGRHPSNDELGEKAKAIFSQLPRYKDEQPPEFSPGWIHRFKKRYGLLIRRQRRHDNAANVAEDINYLIDAIPRFMSITADTSPAAIRDSVMRVIGVECSLSTCARARDEIIHRLESPHAVSQQTQQQPLPHTPTQPHLGAHQSDGNGDVSMTYSEVDPEVALQNALRALQEEEADAEAEAAAAREEREERSRELAAAAQPGLGAIAGQAYAQSVSNSATAAHKNGASTSRYPPPPNLSSPTLPQHSTPAPASSGQNLALSPIPSGAPISGSEVPVRCPFCVNQRMLRTIKESVEHMSTHVVV
jgi:hypothetical protein